MPRRRSAVAELFSLGHLHTFMQIPDIETRLRDTTDNVLYRIMAYRKLTEVEAALTVKNYLLDTKPRDRPKPGDDITIRISAGIVQGL